MRGKREKAMKIKFQTLKVNEELMMNKISKYARQGDYGVPSVRPHKKNETLVVFEMENRFEAIIPEFERVLKGMEYRKEIAQLKIEEK